MPASEVSQEQRQPLLVGALAPVFSLPSTPDQRISLSNFSGRPVVLAFYPADWSPVCSDQLVLYQELMPEFQKHQAQVLGISVDGVWCHLAFSKDRRIRFPLLADFEPKGEVSPAYQAFQQTEGMSERALYVMRNERCGVVHLRAGERGVHTRFMRNRLRR